MPYNVIDTTYIAKYKINSNTEIEVFYKDKKLVSVSEVYKVQYNSNGIIRQLIGNDIEYKYNSIDVLKDGIIVDISDEDDDDSESDDEFHMSRWVHSRRGRSMAAEADDDFDDEDSNIGYRLKGYLLLKSEIASSNIVDEDDEDKLINMPSSFVIWKENLKIPLMDCYIKWDALSYEKRREFYTTYKSELNIKT